MSTLYRCRLCLKLARNKIPIFKDDFPKMIEILTGLRVDPTDDFPKTSCIDCANNVKTALRTKKQIICSHKTLLEEFLSKCKEVEKYNTTISNSDIKNINEDDLVEKDGTSVDLNKPNAEDHKIAEDSNSENTKLRLRTLRTMTGSDSKSNIVMETCEQSCQNPKTTELPEKPIIKQTTAEEDDDVQRELNYKEEYDCDDLNEAPVSPVSDSASDMDWTPDKKEHAKVDPEIKQPRKKRTPILKASDQVFFVKKRNTSISRKKKTAETVIRIKKKPRKRAPPSRVTCEICKKDVQSSWLRKHMETHEYNPTTCEFCGLISKSATALRHHVFYYHRSSADEYICDQCGRSFRSKYRLNLHKKKEHGGTKDFECTTCGKKFFEKMHLKRHVDKTHKNIRPYVCDFCGKTFKSRNHIKIHERIHSKEAPYTCHMCGESFKMKLTLRTHLKGVHNVQEVQTVFCDICKRGFSSDLALKAHVNSRIHETEKCQYCSEMFTREYMVNHLRNMHGVGTAAVS